MWQGRVVEIYGPEASGKTTLALHVIAEAQKIGKGENIMTLWRIMLLFCTGQGLQVHSKSPLEYFSTFSICTIVSRINLHGLGLVVQAIACLWMRSMHWTCNLLRGLECVPKISYLCSQMRLSKLCTQLTILCGLAPQMLLLLTAYSHSYLLNVLILLGGDGADYVKLCICCKSLLLWNNHMFKDCNYFSFSQWFLYHMSHSWVVWTTTNCTLEDLVKWWLLDPTLKNLWPNSIKARRIFVLSFTWT